MKKSWNSTNTSTKCQNCNKQFFYSPSAKRKFCSKKCSDLKHPVGAKASHWVGDKVGYSGIHLWLYRTFGKANKCENEKCSYPKIDIWGRILLKPKRYEWANISGEYKRDPYDWHQLCKSCHKKDGIRIAERFLSIC